MEHFTNGINLNGDPLINVSLRAACSVDLTENWAVPSSAISVNPDMRNSWERWQTLAIASFVLVELRFHCLRVANTNPNGRNKNQNKNPLKKLIILDAFPAMQLNPMCTRVKRKEHPAAWLSWSVVRIQKQLVVLIPGQDTYGRQATNQCFSLLLLPTYLFSKKLK